MFIPWFINTKDAGSVVCIRIKLNQSIYFGVVWRRNFKITIFQKKKKQRMCLSALLHGFKANISFGVALKEVQIAH